MKRRKRGGGGLLIGLVLLLLGMMALSARLLHLGRAANAETYAAAVTPAAIAYETVAFGFGRGYIAEEWQLYFNQPDASASPGEYTDGLEARLAQAMDRARSTLDIAAFSLDSDSLRDAIGRAHGRGVAVRVVSDDAHGIDSEDDSHLRDLRRAGLAVRDDGRSGLMHNKFVIIDQRRVWTGSWNFTVNGSYRNNNNAISLASAEAAAAFQAEFDEMFERGEYGKRSRDQGIVTVALDEGEIDILFAPEGDALVTLLEEIARASESIRFMTFVFSLEALAEAMLLQAATMDVEIEGVFEARNSTASWSMMPALHCAGASVRQDGNPYILHHKVIIIDERTVITGSFNFSRSAAERNDENILIIRQADIAGLYLDEWRRIWDSAEELAPGEVDCD